MAAASGTVLRNTGAENTSARTLFGVLFRLRQDRAREKERNGQAGRQVDKTSDKATGDTTEK